jgi:LPS-assembly lipoprotein
LLAVLATILLAGCGFHLRGSFELPPAMAVTQVKGDEFSVLVRELRSQLRSRGARVVDEPDEATAVLEVLRINESRRTLSVSGATGKVSQYEVRVAAEYTLRNAEGGMLVEPHTASLVRSYDFDSDDVLGKDREESLLKRQMQEDLATSILQRLSRLTR